MTNRKSPLFAALGVALLTAAAQASPVTFTWTGATGANWSDPSNWSNNGGLSGSLAYPGARTDDIVTIPFNPNDTYPVLDSSRTVAAVSMAQHAQLTVDDAANLIISGQFSAAGDNVIRIDSNAVITLNGASARLVVSGQVTLEDAGGMPGMLDLVSGDNNIAIEFLNGAYLTSYVTIAGHGQFVVSGSGSPIATFDNQHVVMADRGRIQLAANLDLEDAASSFWAAQGSTSSVSHRIQFQRSESALAGTFDAYDDAVFELAANVDIKTTGQLRLDGLAAPNCAAAASIMIYDSGSSIWFSDADGFQLDQPCP